MSKIPCPSCGEPNFEKAVICWKCGTAMRVKEQPAPEPAPTPAPEPEPIPETIAVPEVASGVSGAKREVMDVLIDIETRELTQQKNFIYAIVLGAIFGGIGGLLLNYPFYEWLVAASIPVSAAKGFIIWTTLGGMVAGSASVFSKYGAVAGAALYTAFLFVIQVVALFSSVIVPPIMWGDGSFVRNLTFFLGYHQFAGYFIGYLGIIGAVFALKRLGRSVELPYKSADNPLNHKPGLLRTVNIALAVLLVISFVRYNSIKSSTTNDPTRVVAGYFRALNGGWDGDPAKADYLLTDTLAALASRNPDVKSTLKAQCTPPSARTIKLMSYGRKPLQSKIAGDTATADITTSTEGEHVPEPWKLSDDPDSLCTTTFKLTRDAGKWRLSEPPTVSYPGQ